MGILHWGTGNGFRDCVETGMMLEKLVKCLLLGWLSESVIYFVLLLFGNYLPLPDIYFLAGMIASRRETECKDLELSLGMPEMADTETIWREGAWRCLGSMSSSCTMA